MNHSIDCREVTKEFGVGEAKSHALRGVNLQIRAGTVNYLVGPSGCGKTTLVMVLGGLLQPTSGIVQVNGIAVNQLSPQEAAQFRKTVIGVVFQQYQLLPSFNAWENVAIPLILAGMNRDLAKQEALVWLDRVQLGHKALCRPAELSGGQQQRIAIARALVHNPPILICDEPTAALDESMGKQIMEIILAVGRGRQRTIIVVTHDTRMLSYGDAVIRMVDGRIHSFEDRFQREHIEKAD